MLVIRHRTGPLAGKEQRIDPRSDRITFGRDSNVCDVVFPPDATIVARRHFALVRKPSGEWTFDLFGDPFVAVNGQAADVGETLHSGSVIELGRHGGPTFQVVLQGEGLADQLPVTDPQERVVGAHAAADHAEKSSGRAYRLALAAVVAALVVAGASWALYSFSLGQERRLDDAVAAFKADQAREASERISSNVQQTLYQAAYLVTTKSASGNEDVHGTASPIAADLLGTNAHIVDEYDKARSGGGGMFVHAPGVNGRVYEVIEAKKHPAYDAFNAFLNSENELYIVGLRERLSASVVGIYDVGTLRVTTHGSSLQPILEIAPRDELENLEPGSPLALAGYPSERLFGQEVLPLGATPTLAFGFVSSMTDEFFLPADPANRRLVHHSIPATGGSSGSPIVGPSGRVVAYLNAGNIIGVPLGADVVRVPNAVLINFGQRADLMRDLVDGRSDATLRAAKQYWAKQTAAFKRRGEVIAAIVNEVKSTSFLWTPRIKKSHDEPTGPVDGMVRELRADGTQVTLADGKQVTVQFDKCPITTHADDLGQELWEGDRCRLTEADHIICCGGAAGKPLNASNGHPYFRKSYSVDLQSGQRDVFIANSQDRALMVILRIDGKAVAWDQGRWYPHLSYAPIADTRVEMEIVSDVATEYTFWHYRWDRSLSSSFWK